MSDTVQQHHEPIPLPASVAKPLELPWSAGPFAALGSIWVVWRTGGEVLDRATQVAAWASVAAFVATFIAAVFAFGSIYGTMTSGFEKFDDQYQEVVVGLAQVRGELRAHVERDAHPTATARLDRIESDYNYIRRRLDEIASSVQPTTSSPPGGHHP